MSITLYDEALTAKIKNWTENTNVHIYGVNDVRKLVETIADEEGDKPLQLPIVTISRASGYQIVNTNKKPMTYDGKMIEANVEKSVNLNAIPINITYQIDVWTRYLKEADEYMRNFIFNIINFPKVEIGLEYNDVHIVHYSSIRIVTDVMDNSDAGFKITTGQFSRLSLGISIDDAYLWDTRIRDNIVIDENSLPIYVGEE